MVTTKLESLLNRSSMSVLDAVIKNDSLRALALKAAERKLYNHLVKENPDARPLRIQEEKYFVLRNLFHSLNKALESGRISPTVRKAILEIFVGNVLLGEKERQAPFIEKYGFEPPLFVTISPEKRCNLRCRGCYAGSSATEAATLDYNIMNRVITETNQEWGSHFAVISGGEPLLYKSRGKDILDLYREHSNMYFMMYTNGTLINEKMAERMAEVGNITPAISVEGLEKETDERRGKGVFKRILKAFENLRKVGVPFGVSLTATRHNADLVVSDELIDFYFEEQGAIYGWIFQYMPIGRCFTLDLMVTPEQRLRMFEREQYLVRERKVFLADFWNSGPIANGCISAGRSGGYFYIDWNGNVTPCVFFPYSTHNIIDVYANGGNLNTILNSPFFKAIRNWQQTYSYMKPAHEVGNQIIPCAIRDHYRFARRAIEHFGARPIDKDAEEALKDKNYYIGLVDYNKKVEELTQDIWEREYIAPERDRERREEVEVVEAAK